MAAVLKLAEPVVVEDTVAALEKALALAKSGELLYIAYAAELREGAIQTCVPGRFSNAFTMLGAIERLKLRFYNLHVEEE